VQPPRVAQLAPQRLPRLVAVVRDVRQGLHDAVLSFGRLISGPKYGSSSFVRAPARARPDAPAPPSRPRTRRLAERPDVADLARSSSRSRRGSPRTPSSERFRG
jgi:hypothetical protein